MGAEPKLLGILILKFNRLKFAPYAFGSEDQILLIPVDLFKNFQCKMRFLVTFLVKYAYQEPENCRMNQFLP